MAGGARNDPNQNPNSEANILITVFVVVTAILLLWWKASGFLVYAFFGIAWGELMIAKYAPFIGLGPRGNGAFDLVHGTLTGRYDAWNVPFSVLWTVKVGTGEKLSYIIAAIIGGLGMLCYHRMPGAAYTNKHSMASLLKEQAKFWGTLSVSANFDPDNAPPIWDQAMRPTDWIKANKIKLNREEGLDEEACTKIMESHLGDVWPGLEPQTPIHVRALMVIFGLHYQNVQATGPDGKKFAAALKLREDIALAYATRPKGAELDKHIDELTKGYAVDKRVMDAVENVTRPHMDDGVKRGGFAYTNTALCEMLSMCRKQRGVLASAEFLWVKGVDRTLWYCLNNVGRRAFYVEGGGAISHWHSERIVDQALVEPHVAEAVSGVKVYLEEQRISDIDKFFKSETKAEWVQ